MFVIVGKIAVLFAAPQRPRSSLWKHNPPAGVHLFCSRHTHGKKTQMKNETGVNKHLAAFHSVSTKHLV